MDTLSTEAAAEFTKVYDTFGATISPTKILEKIEQELGPSEQTIATNAAKVRRRREEARRLVAEERRQKNLALSREKEEMKKKREERAPSDKQKDAAMIWAICAIVFLCVLIYWSRPS